MSLHPHSSVTEFFREAVTSALRNQGVDTSETAEFYLVNLLAAFSRAPIDNEPLGVQLAEAAAELPGERARKLREVGDRSLYISGFFSDSLQRSLVDVDYYIQIGGTAYHQLAGHVGRRGVGAEREVFVELADKFARFVDVLAEVSEGAAMTSDADLVSLYERWLRTGSKWIERRLRALGVLPRRGELQ